MPQHTSDTAKNLLIKRRATLARVQASNEAGILGLRGENRVGDFDEHTELSRALALLSDRERVELEQIDAALLRIEKRTWGLCETCGARIDEERLIAMPEARTCLAHAL